MGKSWHSRCFGCEVCGLNFSTAQVGFHENEGRALCENCYANNVLPKCQGCQAPITDRTMKAMGGQWHVSCFVCKVPIQYQNLHWKLGLQTPYAGTLGLFRPPKLYFLNFFNFQDRKRIFRLFPIISISQNFFSFFFLTLEKIGIDEKVICYHNISN